MSLWKKFQRVGKKAAKFRFTITYHELILEYDKKWIPNSVCIIWCRRNRKTASQWKKWEPSIDNAFRGVLTWPIPEVMEFDVTLYRDPNDPQSFEDKEWAIFVEDRGKDGRKKQQIAASTTIDLNKYVGGCCGLEPGNFELRLNLKPNGKKVKEASLAFSIASMFLKEGKATDEDMRSLASMMSFAENGDAPGLDAKVPGPFSPSQYSNESPSDISFGARVNEMTREWSSLLIGPRDDNATAVDTIEDREVQSPGSKSRDRGTPHTIPRPSENLAPDRPKKDSFVDLEIASSMFAKCNPGTNTASPTAVFKGQSNSPLTPVSNRGRTITPTKQVSIRQDANSTSPTSTTNSFPYKPSLNGGYYGSLRVKNGQFISSNLAAHASLDKPSLANRLASSFRRKKSKGALTNTELYVGRSSVTSAQPVLGQRRTTLPNNRTSLHSASSVDQRPTNATVPSSSPKRENLKLLLASSTSSPLKQSEDIKRDMTQATPAVTYPNIEASLRSPAIDLLDWCKDVTSYYPGLRLDNFTSSFRDGRAFCAIINHFQPNTIDVAALVPQNVEENNRKAFNAASLLGIPPLLEPYEMIQRQEPDKLAVITYLFQLKTFFERRAKDEVVPQTTAINKEPRSRHALPPVQAKSAVSVPPRTAPFPTMSDANPNPTLDELVNETASYLITNDPALNMDQPGPRPLALRSVNESVPLHAMSLSSAPGTEDVEPVGDRRKVPVFQTVCPSNRSFPIYRQLPKPHKAHSLLSVSSEAHGHEDTSSLHAMNEINSVSREKELKIRALQLIKDAREKVRLSLTPPPVAVSLPPQDPVQDHVTLSTDKNMPDVKKPTAQRSPPTAVFINTTTYFPNGKITALTNEFDFQWSEPLVELTPTTVGTKRPSVALSKLESAFSSHVQRFEIKENSPKSIPQTPQPANDSEFEEIEKKITQPPVPERKVIKPTPSSHKPQSDSLAIDKTTGAMSPDRLNNPTQKYKPISNGYADKPKTSSNTLPNTRLLNDVKDEKHGSPSYLAYSALRFNGAASNGPPEETIFQANQNSWRKEPPPNPFNHEPGEIQNSVPPPTRGKYFRMEFENIASEQSALDDQASRLENQIRDSMVNKETHKENILMREWFVLVDKKNSLLRQQTQLNILEQEKNLEKKYEMLKTELQKIIDLPVFLKTLADEEKEKALIEELVSVVNQRDELVQHLDDQEQGLQEDQAITTKLLSSSRQLFYNSLPRQLKRGAQELSNAGDNYPCPALPPTHTVSSLNNHPSAARFKMGPGSMATLPANLNASTVGPGATEFSTSPHPNDANCLLQ